MEKEHYQWMSDFSKFLPKKNACKKLRWSLQSRMESTCQAEPGRSSGPVVAGKTGERTGNWN